MFPTTQLPKKNSPPSPIKTIPSPAPRKSATRPDSNREEPGIPSEAYFKELLIIERKRSERLNSAFVLLLIDLCTIADSDHHYSPAARIYQVIRSSIRSTDIVGWHSNRKIMGIILTGYDKKSIATILHKVSGKIRAAVTIEQFSAIRFSHVVFPETAPTGSAIAVHFNSILYTAAKRTSKLPRVSYFFKRCIDISGSLAGIILFSPLFVIIPLLIKCTSKGKIFFRQNRVGQFGEHFTLLKFRTMYETSNDTIHRDFIRQFIKTSSPMVQTGQSCTFKMKNDPRITAIGKYLRKTSLDELPQFFNILLGNMSLVGPRPAIPYEVDEYDLWHRRRVLEVKPGLTGFWQVKGRSSTDFETMVRMDLAYIKNWSPALDLKLILQTPLSLITAKGAY